MPDRPAVRPVPSDSPPPLEQARQLQADGQWAQAIPCYELAREQADDCETVLVATRGIAFSHRILKAYDAAEGEYRKLARLAVSSGSVSYQLDAQLGLAKIAQHRGDLSAAALGYDAVIAEARRTNNSRLLGKALLDRSVVAGMQHEIPSAISFAYEALDYAPDDYERDAILLNLAEGYRLLGEHDQAYRLALTVQHSAHQNLRVSAGCLAMHLMIDKGWQLPFVRHREWLFAEGANPDADREVRDALDRGKHAFNGEGADPFVPLPVTPAETAIVQHIGSGLDDRCAAILRKSA